MKVICSLNLERTQVCGARVFSVRLERELQSRVASVSLERRDPGPHQRSVQAGSQEVDVRERPVWSLYLTGTRPSDEPLFLLQSSNRRKALRGNLLSTCAASRVPRAVCRVPRAACRVPCAACRVPCAACRVPRAACRVPRAACRVPRAACRVPRAARRAPRTACRVHAMAITHGLYPMLHDFI